MNVMSFADFKKTNGEDIFSVLPLTLTFNGEPRALVGTLEDTVLIGDLHPRVKTMLKAQEKRARAGMPQPEKIYK